MPRGLRGVQRERDASRGTDLAHSRCVLHRAGHIGCMREQHQPGVGAQHHLDSVGLQPSGCITRDAVEGHAAPCQLGQRPHDRVVLHRGDQHMIARPQRTEEQHIQPPGVARSQNHMRRIGKAEQRAKPLPQAQGDELGLLRRLIRAAADRRAHLVHIFPHARPDLGRLGERSGGVVQIYGVHSSPSRRVIFFSVSHRRANVKRRCSI